MLHVHGMGRGGWGAIHTWWVAQTPGMGPCFTSLNLIPLICSRIVGHLEDHPTLPALWHGPSPWAQPVLAWHEIAMLICDMWWAWNTTTTVPCDLGTWGTLWQDLMAHQGSPFLPFA